MTLALIEDKFNSATASTLDASWELIRNYLLEKRTRQAARAGEELTRHDITRFVTRTRSLLPVNGVEKEPETLLKQSIEEALAVWNEALRNAQENPQVDQIHALHCRKTFTLPDGVAQGIGARLCEAKDQGPKAAAR